LNLTFCVAPARPVKGLAGVSVLLLSVLLAGCKDSPLRRDETLDIGSDTIQLAAGVQVRNVSVRWQADGDFDPKAVQASVGDVVRFRTGDAHTHVLVFDEASLPPGARERMAAKSQLRSPPLVIEGATWIVSLDGAPPGTYTFQCLSHSATGQITVQ
jgi:plastocyanin